MKVTVSNASASAVEERGLGAAFTPSLAFPFIPPRFRIRVERVTARTVPFARRMWLVDELRQPCTKLSEPVWEHAFITWSWDAALGVIAEVIARRRRADEEDREGEVSLADFDSWWRQRLADRLVEHTQFSGSMGRDAGMRSAVDYLAEAGLIDADLVLATLAVRDEQEAGR